MASDIEEFIPDIEKALGIKLNKGQIHYLLYNSSVWYDGDRQQGRTTAYCIKLALSKGDPLDPKHPEKFCDVPRIRRNEMVMQYPKWFLRYFIGIWKKLKDVGLQVRDIEGLSYNENT